MCRSARRSLLRAIMASRSADAYPADTCECHCTSFHHRGVQDISFKRLDMVLPEGLKIRFSDGRHCVCIHLFDRPPVSRPSTTVHRSLRSRPMAWIMIGLRLCSGSTKVRF